MADEFSNCLIPKDLSVPGTYQALKTTGNGNCLFNAISLSINGDESLSSKLREKAAWELFDNKDAYYNHAYFDMCEQKTNMPKSILLHYLLGDDAFDGNSLQEAFNFEIRKTFENKRWCSLLHVLACTTVLQENIVSVFPDVPVSHRPLLHGIIEPRVTKESTITVKEHTKPIVIFWSRDGTFDNEPGAVFNPNHVVALQLQEPNDCVKRRKIASDQPKINRFFTCKSISRTPELSSAEQQSVPIPDDEVQSTTQSTSGTPQLNSPDHDIEQPATSAEIQNSTTPSHQDTQPGPSRRSGRTSSWLAQFKWLEIDSTLLRCSVCRASRKNNIFTRGKPYQNTKKDDLMKHEKSVDHSNARMVPALRQDLQKARVRAYDNVKSAMIAQMATVMTQAKEAIGTIKNANLIRLQVFNGVSSLKLLQSDTNHYQHNESINDIYDVMAQILQDDLLHEREESPYPFFGIEIDEATDMADKSVLVAFIRFINSEGELRSSFLGVKELSRTDADGVFDAAWAILQQNNLPTDRMVGLATDGASVMTGVHKGVATRFKRIIPNLVTVHCMAHRLQLVSEKAANCVPLVTKYISILNQFAKSLKFSPKFQRILEESKAVNEVKARKVKQVFFTRWLSFVDSVQALAGCLSAVISALEVTSMERGMEGRAVLQGVAKQMATVKFLLLTNFLADVVGVLGLLSLQLQKEKINYVLAKSSIDAAIVTIKSMLTTPGPFTKSVVIPEQVDPCGYIIYDGHDFKDKEKDREQVREAMNMFVEELVKRLSSTFPDTEALCAFEGLSPHNSNCLSASERTQKVEHLCDMYNPNIIDKEAALFEWQLLQNVLQQPKYSSLGIQSFLQNIIHPHRDTYQQLAVLASIGSVLPVTSVNCERGISAYNSIKTESRNSLRVCLMDSLMWLYLEAPDLNHFPFERAYREWVNKRERRGLVAMTKKDM